MYHSEAKLILSNSAQKLEVSKRRLHSCWKCQMSPDVVPRLWITCLLTTWCIELCYNHHQSSNPNTSPASHEFVCFSSSFCPLMFHLFYLISRMMTYPRHDPWDCHRTAYIHWGGCWNGVFLGRQSVLAVPDRSCLGMIWYDGRSSKQRPPSLGLGHQWSW